VAQLEPRELPRTMLKERVIIKLNVPLAVPMTGKTSMANDIIPDEEFLDEVTEPKKAWPFASEDDEHRHFDNLQRARDIRSA
jgi:hypothetical protein